MIETVAQEGVVVQWCNPLTLKLDWSGGVGLIPSGAPSPEHLKKKLQTQLGSLFSAIPALGTKTYHFTFTIAQYLPAAAYF